MFALPSTFCVDMSWEHSSLTVWPRRQTDISIAQTPSREPTTNASAITMYIAEKCRSGTYEDTNDKNVTRIIRTILHTQDVRYDDSLGAQYVAHVSQNISDGRGFSTEEPPDIVRILLSIVLYNYISDIPVNRLRHASLG